MVQVTAAWDGHSVSAEQRLLRLCRDPAQLRTVFQPILDLRHISAAMTSS
jgi:hypothetical protein